MFLLLLRVREDGDGPRFWSRYCSGCGGVEGFHAETCGELKEREANERTLELELELEVSLKLASVGRKLGRTVDRESTLQ